MLNHNDKACIITDNIFTHVQHGIIVHQVNCQNVMGAGFAKAAYTQFPCVKEQYHAYNKGKTPTQLFGSLDVFRVSKNIMFANSYTQLYYGNSQKTGIVYTDMNYLISNLQSLVNLFTITPVYAPYGIGCRLAGGSWDELWARAKHLPITFVKMQ